MNFDDKDILQLCVGFRIYDEHGDQFEYPSNKRFYGWPAKYDEWLVITSPRIQKRGTVIRGTQVKYKSMDSDTIFDDSNDLIYSPLYNKNELFAVTRTYYKSLWLMNGINFMGNQGFFDWILRKINDKVKFCNIDTVVLILEIVHGFNAMLYRGFAEDYMKLLKDAVVENIIESPNNNIRMFTKEKIDGIIKMLQEIVKRAYSCNEQLEIIEKFSLDMAYMCFNSDFLERKLQGIKSIMEIIKEVKYRTKRYENLLDNDQLCKWISDKGIFEGLYGPNSHAQLIQRSSDFLKFMVNEDFLKKNDLFLIWKNLRNGNKEERLCIYKLLGSVAVYLKFDHIEFLVKRLQELPIESFLKEDIELLYDITKFQSSFNSMDVYWKLLTNPSNSVSQEVLELVQQKAIEMLKGWDMEKKRGIFLQNLLENLKNHTSVVFSLKLMKKIIEIYNFSTSSLEQYTRISIVEFLITEDKLLEILDQSLQNFKAQVLASYEKFNNFEEGIASLGMSENTYKQEVLERLGFYSFLYDLTSSAFTFGGLQKIWKMCVECGFLDCEKEAVFKLFKNILECKTYIDMINSEDLKKFFEENLCSKIFLNGIKEEGFKCFKIIFLKMNEEAGSLLKYKKPPAAKQEFFWGTSIVNSHYYSISCSPSSQESEETVHYICKIPPDQLQGYSALLFLILNNNFSPTTTEAIDFLLEFYTKIEKTEKINLQEIRATFLASLLTFLKKASEESNFNNCENCLKLIECFLNETEKYGIGDLKPHETLLQGQMMDFVIMNEATSSILGDVPIKFDLKIPSHTLLYSLRSLIASYLHLSPDSVSIIYKSNELKENQNGISLQNLKLLSDEMLTVKKKATQNEIPQAPLLTNDGDMTEGLRKIMSELFKQFSTDGLMSKSHLAKFRCVCINNESCGPTDRRIAEIFRTWDDDNDDYLTEQNFIDFYISACKSNPQAVYRNIEAFNYRTDLKKNDEADCENTVKMELLPRFLLSKNPECYDILFGLIEKSNKTADLALSLLMRLETSPLILEEIRGVKDGNWEKALHFQSSYRFIYELQIIEYLMQEIDWKSKFVSPEGISFLYSTFENLVKKEESSSAESEKKIFAALLKIINTIFLETFSKTHKNLCSRISYLSNLQLSLEKMAQLLLQDPISPTEIIEEASWNLDLGKLLELLLSYLCGTLTSKKSDFDSNEQRSILEYSLTLIFGILTTSAPSMLSHFMQKSSETIIISGVFFHSIFVRKITSHFIYLLLDFSLKSQLETGMTHLKSLLHLMLEYLPSVANRECEQFHELLCHLIEMALGLEKEKREAVLESNQLMNYIVTGLINHKSLEIPNGKRTDRVLIGLIKLCEKFMSISKEIQPNFVVELFSHLLFELSTDVNEEINFKDYFHGQEETSAVNVKCKSDEARKAAYNLVLELCRIGGNQKDFVNVILKGLNQLLSKTLSLNKKLNKPLTRSSYGYSGIRNLGCICYMIAMLQQFFMNPTFRYALLMVNDGKQPELQLFKEKMHDDNVLHQLQEMFGFLELSDRLDYEPHGFCFAFKDFQGEPVNVSLQQDAQEFVNMIFDKLENSLKTTPFHNLLENVYGGRSTYQLICSECGSKKEREELFYSLSLEVKNMKSIYESLDKYIAGEVISDYFCEKCNKKSTITKRSCLSKFPNVLIVHLQRIVFDLDTFQNEKISTRLEFPVDLDLYNYSYSKLEGVPQTGAFHKYRLTGVIIHVGTAQFGHYYSHINIKRDLESREKGQRFDDKWLTFDDSVVREFDIKNLESEGFGGEVDFYRDDWGWGTSNSRGTESSKSAYMLIYERNYKTPLTLDLKSNNKIDESLLKFLEVTKKEMEKENESLMSVDYYNVKAYLPASLYGKILMDNKNLMLERHIFNENFYKFIKDVILVIKLPELTPKIYEKGYEDSYKFTPEEENFHQTLIQFLFKLIYELLPKIEENACIAEFSSFLKHLIYLSPEYSSQIFPQFLERNHKDFIIFQQDRTVRTHSANILLHIINVIVAFNDFKLDSEMMGLENQLVTFLDEFFLLTQSELSKNMAKTQQFFEVNK